MITRSQLNRVKKVELCKVALWLGWTPSNKDHVASQRIVLMKPEYLINYILDRQDEGEELEFIDGLYPTVVRAAEAKAAAQRELNTGFDMDSFRREYDRVQREVSERAVARAAGGRYVDGVWTNGVYPEPPPVLKYQFRDASMIRGVTQQASDYSMAAGVRSYDDYAAKGYGYVGPTHGAVTAAPVRFDIETYGHAAGPTDMSTRSIFYAQLLFDTPEGTAKVAVQARSQEDLDKLVSRIKMMFEMEVI